MQATYVPPATPALAGSSPTNAGRSGRSPFNLTVKKQTSVSLHEQLVTQISLQITSGLLAPGEKLPSIRALSQKLGIHHNTCLTAYQALAQIGLLDLRQGSGARVRLLDRDTSPSAKTFSIESMADFLAEQATRQGYRWQDIQGALEKAFEKAGGKRTFVFVDIHPDILPVFQSELEAALQRPVQTALIESLNPQPGNHFIVSRYHYEALCEHLRQRGLNDMLINASITMIDITSGQPELQLIRNLPQGSLITVLSCSTIILQQAEAIIQALYGDNFMIRSILSHRERRADILDAARRSSLIFTDMTCLPLLENQSNIRHHIIRTIPIHETERLALA